jgi:hypothetical protein
MIRSMIFLSVDSGTKHPTEAVDGNRTRNLRTYVLTKRFYNLPEWHKLNAGKNEHTDSFSKLLCQ